MGALSPSQVRAVLAARELASRRASDPLASIRWLRPQREWLACDAKIKLFRAGSQKIGKSYAGIAEALYRAYGRHPHHPVPPAPVEIIWISSTQAQSLALQDKMWSLIDQTTLSPQTRYEPKWRFGANKPVILFKNGSRIQIYTNDQGSRAIQGKTAHYVAIDELCTQDVFFEARERITATGGSMGLTLTPLNAPAAWLEELCLPGDDGSDPIVTDLHFPLTVENLQYADTGDQHRLADGTICDQIWIDGLRKVADPISGPIRLDGEWENRSIGQVFKCFDPIKHVSDGGIAGSFSWGLGIDYAAMDRKYGQVAVLVQVQQDRDALGRTSEIIYVVGEVVCSGITSTAEFARRVIRMLADHGLRWHQLGEFSVYGDNPVMSRWEIKSNIEMMKALSRELGVSFNGLRPRCLDVKEGIQSKKSREAGVAYLYERIASGAVRISKRCPHLIEALQQWDSTEKSEWKDAVDALRYALKPYIFQGPIRGSTNVRFAR